MSVWTDFPPGDHRVSCQSCGRGERDKTVGLTIEEDGRGVAHCFRCGHVETWRDDRAQHRPGKAISRPVARVKHEVLSDYGRELWDACRPVHGAAAAYLEARQCVIAPADGDMRYHPALKHPSGHVGPALVALITDAVTREPMSLHRTWIKPDGTKADVDPPRLLLGGHRKQGGVIRLWPDEAVTTGLAVGEGIETMLTMARVFRPVWACIDAGNLADFPPLPGIEALTIAADHDKAGIAASDKCAAAWRKAGKQVRVVLPPAERSDLNDLVKEAA